MNYVKILKIRPNLLVTNIDNAIEYYQTLFNFNVVHSDINQGFALLTSGETELVLLHAKEQNPQSAYIYVDNVDSLYSHCNEHNEVIIYDLTLHPYGMKDFTIQDPYANKISIGQKIEI